MIILTAAIINGSDAAALEGTIRREKLRDFASNVPLSENYHNNR
jgi:hypothetical protein